jgi:hypothetical protein
MNCEFFRERMRWEEKGDACSDLMPCGLRCHGVP